MCVFTHRRASTHTDRKSTHAPWTVRTNVYQQFYFHIFIIISRDSNACVCMRLTFCFSFITCSVSICFIKNYVNTRQAHIQQIVICFFVRSQLSSYAAISYEKTLLFCMCTLTAVTIDFIYYCQVNLRRANFMPVPLLNRNITYVFVVMGKLVCIWYGKIYVFI